MVMHNCYMCRCDPGPFFVWSTSRYFPREELIKRKNINDKNALVRVIKEGVPICFQCLEKLKRN